MSVWETREVRATYLPVAIPKNIITSSANIWPPGNPSFPMSKNVTAHIKIGVAKLTTTFSNQIGNVHW